MSSIGILTFVLRIFRSLDSWVYGYLGLWVFRSMSPYVHGTLGPIVRGGLLVIVPSLSSSVLLPSHMSYSHLEVPVVVRLDKGVDGADLALRVVVVRPGLGLVVRHRI